MIATILGLAILALVLIAYGKIITKTGNPWWWTVFGIVPIVNFVLLLVVAFRRWPVQRELELTRRALEAATGSPFPPGSRLMNYGKYPIGSGLQGYGAGQGFGAGQGYAGQAYAGQGFGTPQGYAPQGYAGPNYADQSSMDPIQQRGNFPQSPSGNPYDPRP
ncbi:hypothetical protein [Sanguibacter gelidistatuariae]|nr:hypothetical protein [Sanguibacter gelidistatuariae]